MNQLIAKRYAKAFFDLTQEKNTTKAVHNDLLCVETTIEQSSEFKTFLQNPTIVKNKISQIFNKIFSSHIQEETLNFINFLIEKKRINLLALIISEFESFYCISEGIAKVKIKTSIELEKKQLDSLVKRMNQMLDLKIESDLAIDESLIGGFSLEHDNVLYDYSVKTQLNQFKNKLLLSM